MEASIREGYENGDYFSEKMMETDISNEMAFSGAEQVKECSDSIHGSDVQQTEYRIESTDDDSSVVFVESEDIVHNLPDSYEVQDQDATGEPSEADGEEANFEPNTTVEHTTQTTENLGNDYVVEHVHVDNVDISEDQLDSQTNDSEMQEPSNSDSVVEEVNPVEPSTEPIDNNLTLTAEPEEVRDESVTVTDEATSDIVESGHEEVKDEEIQEVNGETTSKVEEVIPPADIAQADVDQVEMVKDDSSSQYVENISNTNSNDTPEVNESADMSSLHLSETSADNLVVEEQAESIQIVEENLNEDNNPDKFSDAQKDQEEQIIVSATDVVVQAPTELYFEPAYHEAATLEDTYVVEAPTAVTVHNVLDGTSTNVIEMEYEPKTDVVTVVDKAQSSSEISGSVVDETQANSENISDTSVKKTRKTRKPICEIPMHIIGHNIAKPLENVPNGKAVPKPRLGVKVPYRNLTSQIVSKAEIEEVVLERSRQKDSAAKGQAMFARSLTQRLAKKLASSNEDGEARVNPSNENKETSKTNTTETTPVLLAEDVNAPIKDDSDLLAILEGDGDDIPILTREVHPDEVMTTSNLKMLEREIALQQLQELPNQAPTPRIYRSRFAKTTAKPLSVPKEEVKTTVQRSPSEKKVDPGKKVESAKKEEPVKKVESEKKVQSGKKVESDKKVATEKKGDPEKKVEQIPKDPLSLDIESPPTTLPKKDINIVDPLNHPKKQPIEIEPQVKVNMVLKTYSRKRNISEVQGSPGETPSKKSVMNENIKPAVTEIPANVYMTKSSRVIKKKVIWDPDETPSRSPRTVLKSPDTTLKIAKPVNKNANAENIEKVVKPVEKKVTEKAIKSSEKKVSPEKVTKKKFSPKSSKTPAKKSLTEVERLLMDEGAVKMLYDLKNTDETVPKKKKDFFSVDRAHKDIIKKANQLKNELQQTSSTESPKSLRKKEGPSPGKPAITQERKMSKDSIRSSVHTPPGSPFPHTQASMLIRRRSSSSISSSDELDSDAARTSRRRSDVPKAKKFKKTSEDPKSDVAGKIEVSEKVAATRPHKFFTVKRNGKHVAVEIDSVKSLFTFEALEELTIALNKLGKDNEINVVSITSSNEVFCSGLDYSYLVANKEDERKEKAKKMAKKVKEFLLCLLHFPKVLIAGIQGECVGLGVTMLPLFDIVIASDAAVFRTPYASLGCFGEGSSLLSVPYVTAHSLASELLYAGQNLTADDAFRRGLVSKLCWPEKYKDTVKSVVTCISKGSKQSLLTTKIQLRNSLAKQVEAALNSETNILIEHWISAECQKNFGDLY